VFEAVAQDLTDGTTAAYPALLAALGVQRSAMGVTITESMAGMNLGFEQVSDDFAAAFADDPDARIFWERARSRFSFIGTAALADAYLGAREKVVRAHAEEIVELSTRVLPLHRGILVMPLVGRIDAARAGPILGERLAAVARHRARVVVIDISGVPVVDADAAAHLVRTARALALLGATPVLVGVVADVARTMIAGGVALERVTTLADLASGLRHALALLGEALAPLR
jgi:rsbT co-antagonist protein RsbR